MRYLIFAVSRICTNAYFMVRSQSYIRQPFTKDGLLKNHVGKMKMPKITKQHFQRLVFCKMPTYVTLIYIHKVAIGVYSTNCKNQLSRMSSIYLYQSNKKTFFANLSNYLKDRHFTANGYQHVIFVTQQKFGRSQKMVAFFQKFFCQKSF